MAGINVKAALLELTDADLIRIVANKDVGKKWAHLAKVNYAELAKGAPRAMRGVRVAIMRGHGPFAHALAHGWDQVIAPDAETDPELDQLVFHAEVAGYAVGPTGARAMLSAVAEDPLHFADAEQIRERFDQLAEAAEKASQIEDDPDEVLDGEEPLNTDDGHADETQDDADPAHAKSGEDASADLEVLQDRAAALRDEAPTLVARLRAAADALEQGIPAPAIGRAADKWSKSVHELLAAAPTAGIDSATDLHSLLEQITAVTSERAAEESKYRDNALLALKMVSFLREAGREDVIDEQLSTLGFASLQEAEEAAGVEPVLRRIKTVPAPPSQPEPPTAVQDFELAATEGPQQDTSSMADESVMATQDVESAEEVEPSDPAPSTSEVTAERVQPHSTPLPRVKPVAASETPTTAAVVTLPPPPAPALGTAPTVVDPPVKSDDPLGEWPWDEGNPPIIARLLLDGQEALAYHLAVAADEIQPRRQLLLFACAAAHCAPSAIELSMLPSDGDIKAFDSNESLLLLAASLRAGLRLGYAPLGLQSLLDAADAALTDRSLRDVLHAAAAAVQRGHGRRQPQSGPSAQEMAGRWAELGTNAAKHLQSLRDKTLKLQRGSKLLRYLVRDGQPLATALSVAADLTAQGVASASSPEWARIEEVAEQLRDQGDRERLLLDAEAAVSTPQQRSRRAIDGRVKNQLDDLLSEAGDQLSRLLTVRRAVLTAGDLKDIAVGDDLERALSQAPTDPAVYSVGDAAVANFIEWLRAEELDPSAVSVQEVLDAALLEVFEIPRDVHGRPLRAPTATEVASLLAPRDPGLVVSGYLDKGDIAAARFFIDARGLEDSGYDDKILQATKVAKASFEKACGDAEEGVARLRALYNYDLARDLGEGINQIVETGHQDRFDLSIEGLEAITAEAEAALGAERETLKARVQELACDEAAKARVLNRIEARDEPLAVYFLSVLQAGGELQEVEEPSGDDFSEFVPRIVDLAAEAQAAGHDAVAAVREALQATPKPVNNSLREGLAAWQSLKTRRRSGDDFKRSLGSMLRMAGLIPKAQSWYRGDVSNTTAGGYATIRVAASPVDRSYVPQFGSQALGEYDITLVWDPASPSRLMDFIGEGNRNRPNIIVYFGVLTLAERRHLRTLTRTTAGGKGFSPLVIDEAVIGWLSHLTEPGWRFTQRVTLPFTTLNPYQPNAAGEVPEEVFKGRSDERARIENPTGSMFVYGGRQLGKSALLRRVEHLYTDLRSSEPDGAVAGKAAVYIDLKAAGVGEAQEPAQLWPVLGERLHKKGILAGKAAPRTANDVTAALLEWLNSEESNRLLLLLDEADNFLTADSKAGEGEVGDFPVLNALKDVMEQSHRRFKAVFAGLHQVQRFFDASNTPVAHGGDAIPIGPLRTHDACELVMDPLGALGYRFENPELVWRLLLVTNYQASLVQIVCDALVRYLQKRQIPESGGRMIVTAQDVRDVCSDPKVRELIAQRFRWTINLDSRYRVIALVVALNSIGADPGVRFTVDELREWCEVWWADGFSPDELSRNEFERYLIEMQGLGILQQHEADLWALRSPNVIQMLGTRDRLEKELGEAEKHLERPLEYNPTMARHIMGDTEGPAAPRSPLTDYELTQLLKDTYTSQGVPTAQVVFGSAGLGIDRVVEVIQRQAQRETGLLAIVVKSLPSPQLTRVGAGGKRAHVIVDLSQAKPDGNLAHLCREAAARKNVTATVVVGPAWLESLSALDDVPVHKLSRWSTAGLRAWYDSPFDSPTDRHRLHRATSGWPRLIEEVMADFVEYRSPQDSLERLSIRLATPERARQLLADSGIDPQIAKAWVNSVPFSSDGDGIEQLPVSVEDVTEALGVNGAELLGRLEALDVADQDGESWFLDRIILAAAATLYQGSE